MTRRKRQALLTTVLTLLTAVLILIFLIVGVLGTATAQPKKNQIVVPASCTTDGQSYTPYTFVINGMAKTGHLTDSTGNIVITSYTVSYFDDKGKLLDTDTFNSGTKLNSRDDIVSCSGEVDTTLQGLGDVTAVYEFKGFLTPAG